MRILIAEDNVVMAQVLHFNLSRTGHQVAVAENGAIALKAAQRESFDLVISDYQMPVMDGYDAARLLLGLYPVKEGRITLDGLELHEIDPHALRRNVPRCTQSPSSGQKYLGARGRASHRPRRG